jgi:hypothetical protein
MKRRRKAKPAPVTAPYQREISDAASRKDAIRTRIRLIAAERGLPESEIKKVIGRLSTRDVICFMQRHDISADWLLCGDLKGLLRMVRVRPQRPNLPLAEEDGTLA